MRWIYAKSGGGFMTHKKKTHSNDVLFTDASGVEFTEADAARIAKAFESEDFDIATTTEVWNRKSGRPPLFGQFGTSPQITFRLPEALRDQAVQLAKAQEISLSQLARRAFEDMLRKAI
jgi:predicted HicB family RNase H-like nuclease